MEKLIEKVNGLRRCQIKLVIDERISEFLNIKYDKDKVFSELCFCLLTANYQAEKSWVMQKKLEKDFFEASLEELRNKLKDMGHRFWPQRAERIVMVREIFDELFFSLDKDVYDVRKWIVKNVKGLGMKEASHFLRNIGYFDVAIIDFHIVDLLVKEGLIEKPKTITPNVYVKIEEVLGKIAKKLNLSLGKLDLYLWYLETGKVLK